MTNEVRLEQIRVGLLSDLAAEQNTGGPKWKLNFG